MGYPNLKDYQYLLDEIRALAALKAEYGAAGVAEAVERIRGAEAVGPEEPCLQLVKYLGRQRGAVASVIGSG
jgi:hypothetical protein